MAFPTISGSQTSSRASSAITDTVTLPASISAGDLIIVFHFTDSAGASATVPSPWVEIKDAATAGTGSRILVAYLIASGGETSVVVTKEVTERFAAIAIRIAAANWHGTTPPEISTGATGTSTTPDPDSLTASWGAEDNLWLAVMAMDDSLGTNTISAYPYASNNIAAPVVSSAGGGAICSTTSAVATLNPGTFTITSDEWWAGTVAVRPAASGTTLVIQDGTHAHTTDAIALTQDHNLAIADATHGHTTDAIALTQDHNLAIADATHAHTTDAIALTQVHNLTIADATHAHTADNLILTVPGAATVGDGEVVAASGRWQLSANFARSQISNIGREQVLASARSSINTSSRMKVSK